MSLFSTFLKRQGDALGTIFEAAGLHAQPGEAAGEVGGHLSHTGDPRGVSLPPTLPQADPLPRRSPHSPSNPGAQPSPSRHLNWESRAEVGWEDGLITLVAGTGWSGGRRWHKVHLSCT